MTAAVGAISAYGASACPTRRRERRGRRRELRGMSVSATATVSAPSGVELAVQDLLDLLVRALRGRLHGLLAAVDLAEHVLQHVRILDVHPVRRRRDEPARRRGLRERREL